MLQDICGEQRPSALQTSLAGAQIKLFNLTNKHLNAELNSAVIIAECFNVLSDEAIGIWDCRLGQKLRQIMNRSRRNKIKK